MVGVHVILPKPERLEVGQWWGVMWGCRPFRVAAVHPCEFCPEDGAFYDVECDDGWLVCGFSAEADGATYLGSGEVAQPSDWLIDQCARHAYEVLAEAALVHEYAGPRHMWHATLEEDREREREYARSILNGEDPYVPIEELGIRKGAVLDLARVLREEFGRW
jgi:hypothetical protein